MILDSNYGEREREYESFHLWMIWVESHGILLQLLVSISEGILGE